MTDGCGQIRDMMIGNTFNFVSCPMYEILLADKSRYTSNSPWVVLTTTVHHCTTRQYLKQSWRGAISEHLLTKALVSPGQGHLRSLYHHCIWGSTSYPSSWEADRTLALRLNPNEVYFMLQWLHNCRLYHCFGSSFNQRLWAKKSNLAVERL